MKVEVVTVDERGNGYCIVYRDDGSSFGQHFSDLPIEDGATFFEVLAQHMDEADQRNTPRAPKTIDPAITALVHTKVPIIKPVKVTPLK